MLSYRKMFSRAGCILMPALLLLLGFGCERQSDKTSTKPEETASAAWSAPQIDLEKFPPKLQERVKKTLELIKQTPDAADPVGALGAICYAYGEYAAAEQCYEKTCANAPDTMHWRYYQGLAAEAAGMKEKAIKAYERALELDANYQYIYVRLAGLLVESDHERAERLCRRALEIKPDDALSLYTLGRCLETAGNASDALHEYEEALKIAPKYRDAHEAAARLCAAAERTEEAEKHKEAAEHGTVPIGEDTLLTVLYRQGFHLDALLHHAAAAAERGLFTDADQSLSQAAEADRMGAATHEVTGYVRMLEKRYEEAATEYRAALELKPELTELRGRLADVLALQNKFPEAEVEFHKVLEKNPDDAFALEHLARLLMVLKRADEAEKLLRDARERHPDEAWLSLQLGIVLSNSDKFSEAAEAYKRCLELAPDSADANYHLGLVEERLGDVAAAVEHWGRAVELYPSYVDAHLRLTNAALQRHDLKAAEQCLRNAMAHNPDVPSFSNSLAWLLATSPADAQRNGEEAVRLAEKACRLTDNLQHVYLDTLAAAQAELGKFEEAATSEQKAIELAQKDKNAELVQAYEKRLTLYKDKKPYREPAP